MFSKSIKTMQAIAVAMIFSSSAFAHSIAGTLYLSTIFDRSHGSILSRSLVQFNTEGTMNISDSSQAGEGPSTAQHQGRNFSPFGIQHGYWKSCGKKIVIKTFDFSYPKYLTINWPAGFPDQTQTFAMVTGTLRKRSGKYTGALKLRIFSLNVHDINHATPLASFDAGIIELQKICKP
jgi:hypothetical protein